MYGIVWCMVLLALVHNQTWVWSLDTTKNKMWISACPQICSCIIGRFADLPVNHWLKNDNLPTFSEVHPATNEAFYESSEDESSSASHRDKEMIIKIAICTLQGNSNTQKLFQQLPGDVQALTLLQTQSSEEISLEEDDIKVLHNLIYLDLEGYCPDHKKEALHQDSKHCDSIIISYEFFKPLQSLQYLNLQNVQISGNSRQRKKEYSEAKSIENMDNFSNDIPLALHTESGVKKKKLLFLSQVLQEESLPYELYKERKKKLWFSTFTQLSNLLILRIIDCGLRDISWEMFESLGKLEHLSLERNQLLFIPDFAFYGTPNLKSLSLAHNKLLNMQSIGLAGLLELEKLDLSHNQFSHLSEFSLPPFPKLQMANFRHNPIEAVFASTFEIMNATTILSLGSDDSPLSLHPNSFIGLNSLKNMNIHNVEIYLLERQLLSGMPQLKELGMSGKISAISFDAFLEVPLLEKLVLHNCKIEYISMDAFYGLQNLLHLDLSNNLLNTLPPGIFDQQILLEDLLLQNNQLAELPEGFFPNQQAKMIRLDGNKWHCSCAMKDWKPSITNRVKGHQTLSQPQYDKGTFFSGVSYTYEKKVAPRCTTPIKYKGWSVYHVLRKELECTKELYKHYKKNIGFKIKYKDLKKRRYYEKKNKKYISSGANIEITIGPQIVHSAQRKGTVTNTYNIFTENSSINQIKSLHHHHFYNTHARETEERHQINTENGKLTTINSSKIPNTLFNKPEGDTSTALYPTQTQINLKTYNNGQPTKKDNIGFYKNNQNNYVHTVDSKSTENPISVGYMSNPKTLKKIWKEKLQRHHEEKLKKYS